MTHSLKALCIDSRRNFAASFRELLWPEIQFESEVEVQTVASAFQNLLEESFQVCFIGETIRENLDSFFRDIQKLESNRGCVFVRVVAAPAAPGAEARSEAGFHAVISQVVSDQDKKFLCRALEREYHRLDVEQRSQDLAGAVAMLLKAVDSAASDAKRGHGKMMNTLAQGLVRLHAEFDGELLERYFERLSVEAEKSEPVRKLLRSVPQDVLRRSLPQLSSEGYRGASSRVGGMILDRFGDSLGGENQSISDQGMAPDPEDAE